MIDDVFFLRVRFMRIHTTAHEKLFLFITVRAQLRDDKSVNP